jgi:3-methylfumaryl-CoA hydratase
MRSEFADWVGRVEQAEDTVSARRARALAAVLDDGSPDRAQPRRAEGAPLPPLWHWLAFLPDQPMSALGPDGHARRGGFLPPVPLARRMWAGGRLRFLAPIRVGERVRRRSEIAAVSEKTGRSGRMVFVTVLHRLETGRGPAVEEAQDLVYVAIPERFAPPPPSPPPAEAAWAEAAAIDPVRLFRFSAVTFNAHRIHYDLPYATEVERYPGLVVHGPLQALLLIEAARRRAGGLEPAGYEYRGLRPLFHFDRLRLLGGAIRDGAQPLWSAAGEAHVCMAARVDWARG